MIALEPDERNLLSTLYAGGLRVSEACGLRWRNLQARGESGQILTHGKGGRGGAGRASIRVTFGEAAGTFPHSADRAGSQSAGGDFRKREHALAAACPCFPCA